MKLKIGVLDTVRCKEEKLIDNMFGIKPTSYFHEGN